MSKSRSGAPKRVAAGLLAGALTVFGLALAPSAGAVADVDVDRLAGATRYGTAAAISAEGAFADATTAILATGENFPDALAASGLAGSDSPAPILLTTTASLSEEALAALDDLGVTDVTVVGGTAAVSPAVVDTLEDEGFTVDRVAGVDRYETAAAIAGETGTAADFNGLATAVIATGLNFPDALTGGTVAFVGGFPLLLTNTGVPAATETALGDLGIEQVIILGGTAAVPTSVEDELETLTGNDAVRLAGVNRFGTAVEVAEFGLDEAMLDAATVLLAAGFNFPDALAGGPLGGELTAPILLMGSLPAETEAFLDAHSDEIARLIALGGTAAISEADLDAAEAAAETVGNDVTPAPATFTSGPELTAVEFVTQATSTTASYRFTFDKVVTGITPVAASFHLYNNTSNTPFNGTAAQGETGNTSAVLVSFTITAEQRTALTVGTVDTAAVNDIDSPAGIRANPEGDIALSPSAVPAGTTLAPDLVSVGNFRVNATGDGTLVDFTWDEAATETAAASYSLLPATQTAANDDLDASVFISGRATTVHTLQFNHAVGAPLSAANYARGFTEPGAAADSTGLASVLQAADVTGGTSNAPDLVSALFQPDTTSSTTGAATDTVTYTYDQPVSVTAGTLHFVYTQTPATIAATSAIVNPSNTSEVIATFADGSLDIAVGASVDEGAVTAATGSAFTNEEDEVSVAGITFTAGRTNGPDLIGVRVIVLTTDPFSGAPATYGVVYTFDEVVSSTVGAAGLFNVYSSTNVRTPATTVARGSTATGTTTSEVLATGFTAAQATGAVLGVVDNGAATDGTNQSPEGGHQVTQP